MGQFLQILYNFIFKETFINYDFYDEKHDPPILEEYEEYEECDKCEECDKFEEYEKIKYIPDNHPYKIDYILNVELVEEKVISNYLQDSNGIFLDIV